MPFEFQLQTWRAYLAGQSGLVHAPTGLGKTLAVWMGPVLESLEAMERVSPEQRLPKKPTKGRLKQIAEPLRVLWITPLRALAADTTESLTEPVVGMGLPWTVQSRTGDTSQSIKRRQRDVLPTALVTTPESLSLLLSYPDSREKLSTLQCVIVDEWHELLGTKRGIQTELGLARLRAWNPRVRTWGLSATLGNLDEAARVLMGQRDAEPAISSEASRAGGRGEHVDKSGAPESAVLPPERQRPLSGRPAETRGYRLITGAEVKTIEIHTVLPQDMARFPWAGHIGLKLLPQVLEFIEKAKTSLLFTNTRSQTEIWFRSIVHARPDWLGTVAIHHGSIDHDIRSRVEAMLKAGKARCVVCTSSLDLGVDFSPVDQVIQVGSPKGVARLLQRAGRSGHRPGAVSRIVCVPTHAFELMEFAAVRDAVANRQIESREPLDRPFDVLAQHLVTIAMGGGFDEQSLLDEVRTTYAYAGLSDQEWQWAMDFVKRGGQSLVMYPQYARVVAEGQAAIEVVHPKVTDPARDEQRRAVIALGLGVDTLLQPELLQETMLAALPRVEDPVPQTPLPAADAAPGTEPSAKRWTVASRKIASMHRMSIGTITS
ncbi:MAG: DEAD/DEAH box helicase, partial [Pyrinomonadaceae bacterium]|nr:DEAD/DEAH box helicase [Phycisphaerales bacterium]